MLNRQFESIYWFIELVWLASQDDVAVLRFSNQNHFKEFQRVCLRSIFFTINWSFCEKILFGSLMISKLSIVISIKEFNKENKRLATSTFRKLHLISFPSDHKLKMFQLSKTANFQLFAEMKFAKSPRIFLPFLMMRKTIFKLLKHQKNYNKLISCLSLFCEITCI